MVWDEYGEGGGEGEPPEDDEGPEEPELDEEDEGPEEPEIDEEDEGPEEPELDEEDEGPEEPELDEEDESPEEPEVDEEDEGPEEPEVDEGDEGPEEPEVDEEDEGPEEPELDEEDEGPEEPELDEGGEKDEELEEFFDELEKGEKVSENSEDKRQEHTEEGDKTSESSDERNDTSLEDQEGGGEGKEHGDMEPCKEDDKCLIQGDALERLEPPLSEADVKKNNGDISYVCRRLSEEEVLSDPKERLYFLRHYHWFLDWREEILEKLNPDELPDFREKNLKDKRKLAAIGDFFDKNKITDISEREPEKCEKVLNKYEELLNKRYNALSRVEPKPTQSERAEPQQEGDEKSITRTAAVSGESEITRFEHSVERIQSRSPLGDTEGLVKQSEIRVEKEVAWDEDSVRRISFEMTRIREAYKTRTERPYAGLLERVEDVDKRIILTVAERGERKWLRDVDFVVRTEKWWVDEKGVTHAEQCMQVFGYKKTGSGETKILEAAVTDKVRMGVEKEDRINLETDFRSNFKVIADKGETGREGENKPLAAGSGSIESGEKGRQKTALRFYPESDEKPETVHSEQVIYRVIHELPEGNAANTVETAEEANENAGVTEYLEKPVASVVETAEEANETKSEVKNNEENAPSDNDTVEITEPIDITQERTTQSKQVVEGDLTPEHSSEKAENENQIGEHIEESSESAQESVSGSEELRWEDAFILVEGRGWRRILPILRVLDPLVEGVRKNGGDEERYCAELRKIGAPVWLSGWMLRQMVYERRIPEGVFRAALDYLGRDAEKELGIGGVLNYIFTSGGRSLIESLGLEERLRCITSRYERGDEEAEKNRERLKFLETFLGEGNLAYFQELVSIWFSKILKEIEENVIVGRAFEEAVEYSKALLEHVEQTLLNEKIGRLSDEEAQQVLERAMEEYKTDDKELVYKRLAEKAITMSPEELRRCIDKLYDEKSKTSLARSELTRFNYFKIYGALGLPLRSKRVCRVEFLRALLKSKKLVDESFKLEGYLNVNRLQKVLAEELSFYEMIEKEALHIYYGGIGEYREIKESPKPKMKYLKDIVELSDIQYALEIFFTKRIPSQLISLTRDEKEAERMRKAVEEAVKYCGEVLEKTVDMLLNERIEKLNDEEVKHIIQLAKEIYPKERAPRFQIGESDEEEEINLRDLSMLAREINIKMTKFRNYFRRKYKNRTRLTKYDYFRILDALKLNSDISKFRIDRKAFLKALFKGEKKLSLEEKETLSEKDKEQFLRLHWSQLPFETHCIFFEEDRRMLMNVALRKCNNSVEELAGRLLEEMGVEYITPHILRAFTEKRAVDIELVLALIGFIINREPEEVVELIKGGALAEVFKNSLLKQKLVDEENQDWLSNLPRDVVREANITSLIEEFEKLTEKIGIEQDEMYNKFFADLPRSEIDKLKDAINKMKKEQGSSEKLYAYIAEKLNKHLKEEVTEAKIEGILRGQVRVSVGLYLSMCKIFGVEPNPELHFRSTKSLMRYLRRNVTEIDFLLPVLFTHRSGETIIIEERKDGFFVVTGGRRLRAEKWKTQYGGKLWGITVIDYVTEEGVFGVVKETGELWLPYVRPWYTHAQGRIVIGFKTSQPIRNLIQTIQNETGLSLKEISEITGIDDKTLAGKLEGGMDEEEKTIILGNLLTLLGLKSTVTQTDIKREIRQLEKDICSMGEIEIPEEQKQNILYINLRTTIGASLIGHLYGDGNLRHRGRNVLFSYSNTELEYIEAVRRLLNFYGKSCNVHTRKGEEKHKEQYVVFAGGFLGYALWCAIPQAEGDKLVSNPKVPSWITGNPILATVFLRAIISDEAHVDPKEKRMEIGFAVNVTRILEEMGLSHIIKNIVAERLRKLWKRLDSLGLSKEELTEKQKKEEKRARTVNIKRVLKEEFGEETLNEAKKLPPNILLDVKELLQTFKINPEKERLDRFYVSETEAITAHWRLDVYKTGTGNAYKLNLFEGYKKQNYERNFKKIVRHFRLNYKLPREQLAEFRKIQEEIGVEGSKEVSLSEVGKRWDSERFEDFREIISKYIPEAIKKKRDELEENGINAKERAHGIYFGKGKGAISIVWVLGWFE